MDKICKQQIRLVLSTEIGQEGMKQKPVPQTGSDIKKLQFMKYKECKSRYKHDAHGRKKWWTFLSQVS
jgi:hypothetical protein